MQFKYSTILTPSCKRVKVTKYKILLTQRCMLFLNQVQKKTNKSCTSLKLIKEEHKKI